MHTGKITIAAALLALSLGLGCQDRPGRDHVKAGQDGQDLETFTEDEVWAVPLASDLDFEQAVEAYQAGDRDFAARRIEEGIAALRNEAKDDDATLRRDTEAILGKLETLARRVREGRAQSEAELRNTFNRAELLAVHYYLVLANYSLDRSPDNQASLRMTATLKALEGAVRHGDDRLKAEAKPLIAESHRLIEAEKKQGRLDRERLRMQTGKLIDFLERAAAGA